MLGRHPEEVCPGGGRKQTKLATLLLGSCAQSLRYHLHFPISFRIKWRCPGLRGEKMGCDAQWFKGNINDKKEVHEKKKRCMGRITRPQRHYYLNIFQRTCFKIAYRESHLLPLNIIDRTVELNKPLRHCWRNCTLIIPCGFCANYLAKAFNMDIALNNSTVGMYLCL